MSDLIRNSLAIKPVKPKPEISAASASVAIRWFVLIASAGLVLLCAGADTARAATAPSTGYSRLIDWIEAETAKKPLMALGELEVAFSKEAHQSNLDYIQNNPNLIAAIKSQLKSSELSWELIESKRRMLAVPERRSVYADLFETYCREVIDYLTGATGLQNPYNSIFTLDSDEVNIPDLTSEAGITALLVHNLAEEFVYTYAFHGSDQGSIAIEMNQMLYVGELGSYTSTLITHADGSFGFEPNRMTVWQNTAENPYSVLMVPAEETFHILLRAATEQAITSDLGGRKTHQEMNQIVEEWVAVEEAMAGGLVNHLLPAFLEQNVVGFQSIWIEDDLMEKSQMSRYRYLKRGIQVVKQLGITQALIIYQDNPNEFRNLVEPITR